MPQEGYASWSTTGFLLTFLRSHFCLHFLSLCLLVSLSTNCVLYCPIYINRKEGNDQESIQLTNISVQDTTAKEGRTKSNGTTIKTLQAESQKDHFCPKIGQMAIRNNNNNNKKNNTRTYMQRHTMTETVNNNRSTALERLEKTITWWLKSILRGNNHRL